MQTLPKYTSGDIIAAMQTLPTLEKLDEFFRLINTNVHLSKQYKLQVKVQYARRRKMLEAATDDVKPLSKNAP